MMGTILRIPRTIRDTMRADLIRPHPFAAERIGFASARIGKGTNSPSIVMLSEYHAVPDDQYIDDPESGARIDAPAIRAVMQRVLDSGDGAFHVHAHLHRGTPGLSRMDRDEIPRLVESFRAVGPNAGHGILILSLDSCFSLVWTPGNQAPCVPVRIGVVGYPLTVLGG